MSTRLPAFDDIDQLREDVDSGGLGWFITLEPQPVYLTLTDEWVVVVPPPEPTADPIIIRTVYDNLNQVQTDKDSGYILETGFSMSIPVYESDFESSIYVDTPTCGPVLTSAVSTSNTGGKMYVQRHGLSKYGGLWRTPLLYSYATYTNGPFGCGSNASIPNGFVHGLTAGDSNKADIVATDYEGNELWRYTTPGTGTIKAAPWGSSAGVYGDFLVTDAAGNTYSTFRSDDGFVPGQNRTGVFSLDVDGNLRWFLATNTLNTGTGLAVTSDGTRVVVNGASGCTWDGGGVGEEIAVINGATGALVATYDVAVPGISANTHYPIICGASENKVMWFAEQPSTTYDFFMVDLNNMATVHWTLDPATAFGPANPTHTLCHARLDGGLFFSMRDATGGATWVASVDEDGTVANQLQIESLPAFTTYYPRGIEVDPDGNLYVVQTDSARARIAKIDAATFTEVWEAFEFPIADSFGGSRKLTIAPDNIHMTLAETGYSSLGGWVSMFKKIRP